jgi:glycine/D-amino acid oxidase-like deaminating enzyme
MKNLPDVVICGAGIAGISCAYHLSVLNKVPRVWIVDDRAPLSLTSDKSSECYRNWWPDQVMVSLVNRSIDLMMDLADQTGNSFQLNQRGYLYVTQDTSTASEWLTTANKISDNGAGALRIHRRKSDMDDYAPRLADGYDRNLTGADLIYEPAILRKHFPYLSDDIVCGLHARRAGWFSAQQMGMNLLEQAREQGIELIRARLTGIHTCGGRVNSVELNHSQVIDTAAFVNAAGPLTKEVLDMLDISLPVENKLHLKATINDHLLKVPREAPLLIWGDPQMLSWNGEEKSFFAEEPDLTWVLGELPSGAHCRPEGYGDSRTLLLLWEYQKKIMSPGWPIPIDPLFPELTLRGLSRMVPGLSAYLEKLPRAVIDGGYYTYTPENRPLIGPLRVPGAYVCGAFSGFGLMAACAAGELLAAHLTQTDLPLYAKELSPARYEDLEYVKQLDTWGDTGQL